MIAVQSQCLTSKKWQLLILVIAMINNGAKQSCYVIISVNIYHENHFMINIVTIFRGNGFASLRPSQPKHKVLRLTIFLSPTAQESNYLCHRRPTIFFMGIEDQPIRKNRRLTYSESHPASPACTHSTLINHV